MATNNFDNLKILGDFYMKLILGVLLLTFSMSVFSVTSVFDKKPIDSTTKSLASRSMYWLCEPKIKFRVDKKGARRVRNNVWIKINLKNKLYARCDKNGCSKCDLKYFSSGIYTNIALPNCGGFIKLSNDGSTFVDVASLMNIVFVSYGACKISNGL